MADRTTSPIRLAALLLVAIAAGIALGVGIDVARTGGPSVWLARHGLPPPYVAMGTRHDIGARELYLDCRGSGSPTIVLEAGSGSDSGAWSTVHDTLASTTRTCAYDRAGRGRSDPGPTHTLAAAAADLQALLATAGEEPPFVLVGHSLGGAYARVFADRYRSDVVGIVLVDGFDPDLQEDWIDPLLGSLTEEYEAGLDRLRAVVSQVDGLDWAASELELRSSRLADLPIVVLTAPRHEPRLDAATNEAIVDARTAGFELLSPGNVEHVTAWGAGHLIQIDRPDIVIDAVRRLVEQICP